MREDPRMRLGWLPACGLAVVTLAAAACTRRPAPDPAYAAEVEKWHADRLARLTGEDGWLTLVGIHWLRPGENRFGNARSNEIVLAGEGVPAEAGTLELGPDRTVLLHARPGAGITLAGATVTEAVLRPDTSGKPDVLELAGLRMHLIARGDAMALRVRDPESPRRVHFPGIEHFPIDPRLRVEATLERSPAPRDVSVPSAQGPAQKMLAPGVLEFRIGETECTLEPFLSSPDDDELFIVFSDATAGVETYGAGRFLDTPAPAPGSTAVVLDFNLAYNPPCAFTPYATCPLPLPRNVLPVRIEAGEKAPASH